jgi:hypothetical protein
MKLFVRFLIGGASAYMLWFSVFLPQNYQALSSASLQGQYGWAVVLGFLLAYLGVELASRKARAEVLFGVERVTQALWGGMTFALVVYLMVGNLPSRDIVGTIFVLGVSGFIAGVAILGVMFSFKVGMKKAPSLS